MLKSPRARPTPPSLASIDRAKEPACDGVPLIIPVAEFRFNPVGNVPAASDHRYGGVPPLAAKVCRYAAPSDPLASEDGVVSWSAAPTRMVKVRLAVEEPASV